MLFHSRPCLFAIHTRSYVGMHNKSTDETFLCSYTLRLLQSFLSFFPALRVYYYELDLYTHMKEREREHVRKKPLRRPERETQKRNFHPD